MCSFAKLQTDLVAADLYWGSEPCIRSPRQNATLFSLKGCCSSAWRHLYIAKLWTDHIHFCSTRLLVQLLLRYESHQGTELRAESMLADPYHWTTSLALLPYLFIFKQLNILDFCTSLGVKREWTHKTLLLLPNNRGYMLLQKDTDLKFRTHLLNEYRCKNTNKRKLILRTTILKIKPI